MRIAIGGFFNETNSFSNTPVTWETMHIRWYEREDLLKAYTGVQIYSGGFIDEAKAQNVEIVPTLMIRENPSGHARQKDMETMRDYLVSLLWESHQEKPLDGIVLNLHGAAVADGYPDVDGEILRTIRAKFGREIPIGVASDLHGNISDTMMELADVLVGVKTYPHVDEYEAGRAAFALTCDIIRTGIRPAKRIVRLPWHIACAEGLTVSGPAHDIQQLCYQVEREDPELLQATFFQGFPYSDIADACVSVVTIAKTQEAADRNAMQIARYAWSRRKDFGVPIYSAKEAMDMALQIPDGPGPVVISDSADNPGGGAPCDGTHLLREMIARNVPSAMGYLCDPEVIEQAVKAGVGATIHCKLGGKTIPMHGEPLEVDAYVKCISDGNFINQSPKGKGALIPMGRSVCLVIGNVHVVVCPVRFQPLDDGIFRMVGLFKDHLKIVALKSSQHFKAWWTDQCRGIIPCETPGIHSADLRVYDFQFANKNYYPLVDAQWEG